MILGTLFYDMRGCMGERRLWAMLAAAALLVTACSDSAAPPTLAPGTTAPITAAPPATIASTTSTAPPTTSTSVPATTAPSITTTQSPDARFAEIERMAQEAFVGRLKAIYDKDKEALLQWVGSQAEYDLAVKSIVGDRVEFAAEPDNINTRLSLQEVLLDREDCVVAIASVDLESILGVDSIQSDLYVWWPSADGQRLLDAALWAASTPEFQWIEECDIATRGIKP